MSETWVDKYTHGWEQREGEPYGIIDDDEKFAEFDKDQLIVIMNDEYLSLKRDERMVIALESAGVDNWEGYSYVNWEYVESGEGKPSKVDN